VKGVAEAPDIDENDVDIMLSTNFTGLVNMTQSILSIYKQRPGCYGDIVNIGSIAGNSVIFRTGQLL
jgi:3-hydroxy acid dehydrogenase/malonic semialdehyde reductase